MKLYFETVKTARLKARKLTVKTTHSQLYSHVHKTKHNKTIAKKMYNVNVKIT